MKTRKWFILFILALALLVPAGAALADYRDDGVIKAGETIAEDVSIYGSDFVIETGGTLEGTLLVFGGSVTVDGTVEEDLYVYGGTTTINGTIERDLVIYGGYLDVTENAELDGDCVLLGGTLENHASSEIACVTNPVGNLMDTLGGFEAAVSGPTRIEPGPDRWLGRFFGDLLQTIGLSVTMGVLALALASVFPNQLSRVGAAIRQKPVASGTVGLLTAIAVPSMGAALLLLSVILTFVCVGIIGYPIVFVIFAGLIGAGVLGWVTLGQMIGQRLAGWLNLNSKSLAVTAVLGTVSLTLIAGLLDALRLPGSGLVVAL
ncbi:MAG: hypothetical protein KDE34_10785, partial [Anaerolineales bacterium]|nr:hypothetical protein [Anaerolineales bacterium]